MTIQTFIKDPSAVLDYQIDWATYLGSDTIVSSSWVVPTGITQDSASASATTATIWLSGGTDDTTYSVTNRIITAGGRTDDRSIAIRVQNQ